MRISVIIVVLIGSLAGVAGAQPDKAAAQAAFAEGQQRYAAGEYLPAAMKFETAFAFDPDPVYLFNVAQAYRLGNACPKAVTYYRRFLDAVPNPPNLAKVNQYIEQSEACAKSSATLEPGTAIGQPVVPVVITPPITESPRADDDPGRSKRWLGIGAMVIGGAAIGVGVYYTTEASRLTQKRIAARDECPCDPGYGDSIDAEGKTAVLRARISYAAGGALVIGGVALYLLGRNSERSSIAVVPTSDGAYAVGAFSF